MGWCWAAERLSGYINSAEFARSAQATASPPEFYRARYVINDFTHVTESNLRDSLEHVAVMRIGASVSKSKLKVAYVVLQNENISQFVAEFVTENFNCGWDTRVFETKEAAIRWAIT